MNMCLRKINYKFWQMVSKKIKECSVDETVLENESDYNDMLANLQEQARCAIKREHQYVKVLEDFAEHQRKVNRAQRWFKAIFFWLVCAMFALIIAGCVAAIYKIAMRGNTEWQDLGVAITSAVSLIGTVIILPSKIADHLFPNNGEKDIMQFIIDMHKVDTQLMSTDKEEDGQSVETSQEGCETPESGN